MSSKPPDDANSALAVAACNATLISKRRPRRGRGTTVWLVLILSCLGGHAAAQNDGSGSPSAARGSTERVERALKNEEQGMRYLEEHALQSSPASDGPGQEKWRAEFYKAAYWFIVANPRYADSNENQRLLEEVLAVLQADRKTRRIRPVEDIFDLAAERIETRDREAAARRVWQAEVDRFLDEHPVYRADDALLRAFDAAVRTLGSFAENQQRGARELLQEAHSIVSSNFPGRVSGADQSKLESR